jgi:hypothetical protein
MTVKHSAIGWLASPALLLLGALQAAPAAELGSFDLHGYGSQDYLRASANQYLDADTTGSWDTNFLGLVGAVTVNDRSKLWAQLETSSTEPTTFTWFFLDYQVSDAARIHVGRVKYPLGLYNETIDAKFLQVTSLEPALYQEGADVVHDAYTGVGLDYDQSLGEAGEITWQAYVGYTFDRNPPPDSRDRRAYGGRVTYKTPIDGLRFMLSGYTTRVEVFATTEMVSEHRMIASVDYVNGDWDVKSEYGKHKFLGVSSDAWYAQLGHTFADKWMPFARYDYVTTDKALKSSDAFSQKILTVGVNYKLESNVSLRVENQFNRGFALPVATEEVDPVTAKRNWSLLVVGVHFMF